MATYYVRNNGNDANAGTSQFAPLKSFDHARALATPSDTIIMMPDGSPTDVQQYHAAKLAQNGTSDPVATGVVSNIGTIVWTRSGAGVYVGTLAGAFAGSVSFEVTNANLNPIGASVIDANSVRLVAGGDSVMECSITIVVA